MFGAKLYELKEQKSEEKKTKENKTVKYQSKKEKIQTKGKEK